MVISLLWTRTLLVALSLACLEMSFNVKGPGAVILLFRLEYKTSVVCHNVYTQKVKIARRDRLHILASNRCGTFENLLHIDIAPLRSTLSGILHSKNWTMIFIGIRGLTVNSVRAYSCWICCPFYKISISHESNDIFHSCLVSTFNISVQSQSTMFRVVHSMHFR